MAQKGRLITSSRGRHADGGLKIASAVATFGANFVHYALENCNSRKQGELKKNSNA